MLSISAKPNELHFVGSFPCRLARKLRPPQCLETLITEQRGDQGREYARRREEVGPGEHGGDSVAQKECPGERCQSALLTTNQPAQEPGHCGREEKENRNRQ